MVSNGWLTKRLASDGSSPLEPRDGCAYESARMTQLAYTQPPPQRLATEMYRTAHT
jgi:hypothetical protein